MQTSTPKFKVGQKVFLISAGNEDVLWEADIVNIRNNGPYCPQYRLEWYGILGDKLSQWYGEASLRDLNYCPAKVSWK